jgi:hypothetical protein
MVAQAILGTLAISEPYPRGKINIMNEKNLAIDK